jgi:DNA-binding CsgD family transcriptional regulator
VSGQAATVELVRTRARILTLSARRVLDDAFLAELSSELRTVVPFDGAFWAGADPLTTLATSPARLENLGDSRACQAYWDCEFLVQDFNHFCDLARAPLPVAGLYRATGGQLARSTRYLEVNRRMGFADELRAVFRTGRSAWGYVSLFRASDRPPFSRSEERLVAELSRPVGEAFRRSALIGAERAPEDIEGPGMLIFDRNGVLDSLNEPAEAFLRSLPQTRTSDRGAAVPTEVLTVAAQTRAIHAGRTRGVARARLQDRHGRWLVVHGFPLRGAHGRQDATALVIEPAKGSEIAPLIVEAYEFTAREQQITQMIARGLSTREIAETLRLSSHTVRDYIKQIFEKVGVTSRGELVAKIFAEHYGAPLHEALHG